MGINDIRFPAARPHVSHSRNPSYVLKALGVWRRSSPHLDSFGLGRFNTEEEVDYVTDKMVTVVKKLATFPPSTRWLKRALIFPR